MKVVSVTYSKGINKRVYIREISDGSISILTKRVIHKEEAAEITLVNTPTPVVAGTAGCYVYTRAGIYVMVSSIRFSRETLMTVLHALNSHLLNTINK
jgi:hypothetical protein